MLFNIDPTYLTSSGPKLVQGPSGGWPGGDGACQLPAGGSACAPGESEPA